MRFHHVCTTTLIAGLILFAACSDNNNNEDPPVTDPQTVTPQPIPAGYDFPGQREDIQTWADTWEVDKITAKAWNLWAGLNADSGEIDDGARLPVWETWCGPDEAFGKTCNGARQLSRSFHNAHQINHAATAGGSGSDDLRLVAFNKFDPSMVAYLAKQHAGPGGAMYDYTQWSSLNALNAAWPTGTSIADRKVEETPYVAPSGSDRGVAAVELKPVMFLVKQTGLSAVPLWQGLAGSANNPKTDCTAGPSAECHPDPTTWTTCVLVDPAGTGGPDTAPVPATAEQIAQAQVDPNFACDKSKYFYAPLSTLYSVKLDADEAKSFNAVQGDKEFPAAAGDYAVLAAMHVSTKEIVNWTWQTFWWQPGSDTPDSFPGSKQGMTGSVAGSARNYAMCTAYNQTQGAGVDSGMVVCFNPYLETFSGIPDGVQSNCMSCHGTATVGSTVNATLSYPDSYTAPIDFNADMRFEGYTQTDFAWSISGNAKQ